MELDKISFRNNPECPFGNLKWTDYYWKRPSKEPEYEHDYWGTVKDPDGLERNFINEWEMLVNDKKMFMIF